MINLSNPYMFGDKYRDLALKITVVGFLGKDGGKMKELYDYVLVVPSVCTSSNTYTYCSYIMWMIEKEVFK